MWARAAVPCVPLRLQGNQASIFGNDIYMESWVEASSRWGKGDMAAGRLAASTHTTQHSQHTTTCQHLGLGWATHKPLPASAQPVNAQSVLVASEQTPCTSEWFVPADHRLLQPLPHHRECLPTGGHTEHVAVHTCKQPWQSGLGAFCLSSQGGMLLLRAATVRL